MKAFILINVRVGTVVQVVNHLQRVDQVREATMTFGPYDVVAVMEADDVNQLGRILADAVQPIPGIEETLTCLAVDF